MIDWYVIEYLYPESFKRFTDTMFPNIGVPSISILQNYDIKKLYLFFDKQGVYLNVERCCPHIWLFNISLDNGMVFGSGSGTKFSREEIEEEGFIECFRLLDKKLRCKSEKYL